MKRFPLNEAQKQAVETIEGPVMVIAGPGTGKTQTLTARIANILKKTDTPPDGILALTFTDAGARQMRQRLTKTIGPTGYYVNIQTFHSFCSDIIRSHPDVFTFAQTAEPLSDLERVRIFQEVLDASKLDAIRPHGAPYLYLSSLTRAVSNLKREGIDSKELKKLLDQEKPSTLQEKKYHLRNRELIKVYRAYQKKLRLRGRYDFEDMINLVVDAFKANEEFLLTHQQRYLYILVDEYQDTNSAQNELLMLLAAYWGDQANLFVVGDDEQSIFRFQGASVENILAFRELFPQAKLITLNRNYRSSQNLLDASRTVVENNKVSLTHKLPKIDKQLAATVKFKAHQIQLGRFSSGATENFFIAKKIQKLIKQGIPPREIVVIYRRNSDSSEIAELLSRLKITFDLEGGHDVLTDSDIEKLLLLMRAVNGIRTNDENIDLFTLLNYPFVNCDYLDVLKLSRFASTRKINLWEAIDHPLLKSQKLKNQESLQQVFELLSELQQDEAQGPFVKFFEKLINKTGYLNWCLRAPDAIEKLNKLNSLFSEIKRLNNANHQLNLETFLETVQIMRDQRVAINEKDLDVRTNSVTLMTAHKAKGREFQVVFIARAVDGRWGNNQIRELIKLPEGILTHTDISKKEKNEDERRLFYVAFTRAKQQLFITSAESYVTSWGRKESIESMFIHEIPEQHLERFDVSRYESGVKKILESLLTSIPDDRPGIDEQAFLKQVLANFKLSPTALNTYLSCPYKFKLNNLLRVPRAKSSALSFGSAVHAALEHFFREFKRKGSTSNVNILTQAFSKALDQEVLSSKDEQSLKQRGADTLKRYFKHYQDQFVLPLDIERFFGYGWSKIYLGSISLAGKVDKTEPFDSAQGKPSKYVKVVDYKTGRPKSRNEIEGKTKNSTGDYKRQLVFYKLLAQLDQRFNEIVEETELDFVEPDRQTGKFRKESFKISEEEVNDLMKVIRQTWGKIIALKFPRTSEVQKHCPRCEWRYHCWPDGLPTSNEQLSLLQ